MSTLTRVYPDRMVQPVSNSFRYFTPTGSTNLGVSFAYWTAPLYDPGPFGNTTFPPPTQTDFTAEMINENGKIAPAPLVPVTSACCVVGKVSTAHTILENTRLAVRTYFGQT